MPDPQFDFSDVTGQSGDGQVGGGGFNFQNFMQGGGMGDFLGAGLLGYGMSQYQNPAGAGMPYLNQAQQQLPSYFQPYINAGNQALPQLQQQYGQLLGNGTQLQQQYGKMVNNPGAVMNGIGAGFQQSPGYQFQTQQALGAANRAASAGGMLGSPMEQQNIAGVTNQLANQDYYNYLNHGMSMYNNGLQGMSNMYGMGLQGDQSLYGMGYDASKNLGEDMTNLMQSQAQLAYAGQNDQNQSQQGSLGGMGSLISDGLMVAAL